MSETVGRWTAQNLPPHLVALHDKPGGTSLCGLAGILNAYDALHANQAALAVGDRVQLVGLPQQYARLEGKYGTVSLLYMYADGDCEVTLDGDNFPTICERRNLAPAPQQEPAA